MKLYQVDARYWTEGQTYYLQYFIAARDSQDALDLANAEALESFAKYNGRRGKAIEDDATVKEISLVRRKIVHKDQW